MSLKNESKLLPISGVILAGGRSKRFGQDKATYIYKNKRMLDWSLQSLSNTKEQFIVANRHYETDVPIYEDIPKDCSDKGCGPMGGLYTALNYAKHDWVAIAACDMPNLSPEYWHALFEQISFLNTKHAVIIKSKDSKLQTLAALYNKALLPIIERHLNHNMIALHSLSEHFSIIDIDSIEQRKNIFEDTFLNFNYLRDIK